MSSRGTARVEFQFCVRDVLLSCCIFKEYQVPNKAARCYVAVRYICEASVIGFVWRFYQHALVFWMFLFTQTMSHLFRDIFTETDIERFSIGIAF